MLPLKNKFKHMKKLTKNIIYLTLFLAIFSCSKKNEKADGYGNFEATEITISSESSGKITKIIPAEGDFVKQNQLLAVIDTTQLYYTKQQLLATKNTVSSKTEYVATQVEVLKQQLKTAQIEQSRVVAMYRENAATKRQVDEIDGKVKVILEQIKNAKTQNTPIATEVKSVDVQIEKINDQIKKSSIYSPISATVLTKYVEQGEVTAFGKPLFKLADISQLELRVYVSEKQLSNIRIGQKVTVKVDTENSMKPYQGTISWISSQAEFTPKVIQTKEERVNLVYAVKVTVKNDGYLKIGMPAEMWLKQ